MPKGRKKQKKGAKKKAKKESPREKERRFAIDLEEDTLRAVGVVALFALGILAALAMFGLAGSAGTYIDLGLSRVFGWSKAIVPVILIGLGYSWLRQGVSSMRALNYIGLLLFMLSLNGLLFSLFDQSRDETQPAMEILNGAHAGGYLGFALGYPFEKILGFLAATVMLVALLAMSFMVALNTSFERLRDNAMADRLSQWRGFSFLQRREADDDGEYPDYEEEEDEEAYEEEDAEGKQGVDKDEAEDESGKEEPPALVTRRSRRKIDLPMSLLNGKTGRPVAGNIKENKMVIERTLENFGVSVEMGEAKVGPTVTQYTLRPAEGVKLTKVTTLNNDLALALAAHPIRIEAPIPGRSLIGIEVPNQTVAMVSLKSVLESKEFVRRKNNLAVALGKDVRGQAWVGNLAGMPHMLVAGATGSGKSVCLNAIIAGLLYQNHPEDLKLILVDPKRVELSVYDGIPHLLTPVITNVKKTINALRWAISEMERRYELLSASHKRNIETFNGSRKEKMPYIVIVIDELADLMAASAHDVEGAIIRLAQMARAVGIHLILATQRPSVDVITGLIKANITTRVAFSVASVVDSRTILDTAGADKLLGRGDMLYITSDLSKPHRIQGAFVSEEEIGSIVGHLKQYGEPDYNEEVTERQKSAVGSGTSAGSEEDDLYDEAREVVFSAGKASASFLQRRLKVGYARAARLLDIMEANGMVGPADGAKPREILMKEGFDGMIDDDTDDLDDEQDSLPYEKEA